ncbi:DUF342 domain-containing protein [Moritella viscosa]|uniref:Flagellar Assembly Protein A N-terminal region domain-containing protein n=1 Tax=Moritella viscosa TaxID=80854 RepID=A0A1L0A1D1_9GAMM|nr:FapA family protein [Moritella viscosa]SGZ06038.1 Putative uncharacterized protein [Moritella viscosa]SHO09054.1 Putative uncharacterized protein [Moritella viscosa]SHO09108.1 Putative uncharacterized protein [Moritella viscosa]SHO13783.1 Putative uncharacterized protein [Moritella viscosa]SHO16775.1 Putative uncharacterized protein [Moritella viscosa]
MLDSTLIKLSEDDNQAEVRLIPNKHAPLEITDLLELLNVEPFNQLSPILSNLEEAATQINKFAGKRAGEEEFIFILAERNNCKIDISLSEDSMQAEMNLTAAWGDNQISIDDILAELTSSNIHLGIDKQKIAEQLTQLSSLSPGEQIKIIVAEGQFPINGKDAELKRQVSLARERLLQPQIQADGNVDMRNLGEINMVKNNDVLIEKIPADDGTKGFNLLGKELLPKSGKDAKLQAGPGTRIDPNNPLRLLATMTGQAVEVRGVLQIDDMLTIKNVDIGTGHITFKGSILITGDVDAEMIVKSSGDITVMGFVDSATLEAAGDVIVNKGILGRQLTNKSNNQQLATKIKAQGQIRAQFVQYSELTAVGDITITKQLLHSVTHTQGKLTVSDGFNRNGDIIGGTVNADNGIVVVSIGATSGTKTEIFCAMQEDEIRGQVQNRSLEFKTLVEKDDSLWIKINNLPPKDNWKHDHGIVTEIKEMLYEKNRFNQRRVNDELELQQLQLELDQYFHVHNIEVSKCIFDNVTLHIGTASTVTQREYGPCRVIYKDKQIGFDYANHN